MKPDIGDVLINRYTLVSRLREEPGLQAWKANDRVLARDCQLFVINDDTAIAQVSAIASSLALSRTPRFTQVLHLQYWGDIAVVVTQLDAGISLGNYMRRASGNPLSFAAMRSILMETALAFHQLLIHDLTHHSVSPSTVRLTITGVQLADAPISTLLRDVTNASANLSLSQLATRQLAALLYEMLSNRGAADGNRAGTSPNTSANNAGTTPSPIYDWQRLPNDIPSEFRVICERGLGLHAPGTQPIMPMSSISEIEALLGQWTPIKQLGPRDIALPSADGECSVVQAPVLPVPNKHLLAFPGSPEATTRPESSLAGSQNDAQNDNGNWPDTDSIDRDSVHLPPSIPPTGRAHSRRAWIDAARTPGTAELGERGHGINGRPSGAANDADADEHLDFHDIAAQEMANILSRSDPADNAEFLNDRDNTADTNSINPQANGAQLNGTHQFDFPLNAGPAHASTTDADGVKATGRIPIFDAHGAPIEPGAESRRALESERARAATIQNTTLPPSFAPDHANNHTHQTTHDENPSEDDIADTPLLGRVRTKVVAIIVGSIVVVVALLLALHGLFPNSTGGLTSSSAGNWPKIDVSEVPFGGSSTPPSESSSGSSPQASSSGSASASASTSSPSPSIITADKQAKAVPAPNIPINNVPFTIDKQVFMTEPAGQQGLAYYMHLDEPQTAYRFVVSIRTSGGKAYLRANTTSDPRQGDQVAEFSFDQSGTTQVTFTKPVTAQDFLLWMPYDSLPSGGIYINSVRIY